MAPKITDPSGSAVGEDDAWSRITPEPGAFVVGSTPTLVPTRQALGVVFVGPICTRNAAPVPQPSVSKCCNDATHFAPEKSDFTAIRYACMSSKWARLAVKMVPSAATAGAMFKPGR